MRFVTLAAGATIALVLTASQTAPTAATQAPPPTGDTAAAHRAVMNRYCVPCHNERNKTNAGRLALDSVDLARVGDHAEVLEKVILKLRAGLMPPPGRSRPEPAARAALVGFLETELDRHAAAVPNPGRTEVFHRLNRAEYRNAVRDLLALEMDMTPLLPADDASYGFDNIAGVLKISQSRLEQYLTVARHISRAAIGSGRAGPETHEYRVAESIHQYDHVDGLPFGTRGGLLARHHFPQDGDYEFRIDLLCRIGGECDGSVGFPDEHRLLVLVDGEQVQEFVLEPRTDLRPPAERTWRTRVPLKAGPHDIGVTFAKVPSIREVDSAYQRFVRPFFPTGVIGQPHHTVYQPFLDVIRIVGPLGAAGPGQTPTRQRIFTCHPEGRSQEESCALTILRTLARRAYRRPVTDDDLALLMAVYRQDAGEGGFEGGIEAALQALLVSPDFLYRIEQDPAGVPAGTNYRISDLELASRLSFFLWSSVPDDALLDVAERGRLKDPSVLNGQIRRMLSDPRSDALIENFAGQWLLLRNLEAHRPDLPLFPNFDDSVRQAARRETELLFGSVLREDRGVGELLTADYTFVNERLARHYGIPKIYGDEFRRVPLADEHRRGLLGHASILTVTSRPNRTSPVLRGRWILENVLGTPAPEPPPNVPSLQENDATTHNRVSVRERLARHRANAICAGCHAMIDPPGFALENFDAVGQWREKDESSAPIDASGVLPDGTKFDGLSAFRATLFKDPEVFATTVTRKLMTYALGRGLEPYDMPAIRRIVREAGPGGLKLSALVTGIVRSVPFQMRRTAGQ
jgi:mono/diheme cytochrome c family protein